jgi:DNA-directed RNA polymerase subunit F
MPDIEPKYAIRVADLLPQHADDVRSIFQKSRHDLTDDDVAKVLAIVDENYTA